MPGQDSAQPSRSTVGCSLTFEWFYLYAELLTTMKNKRAAPVVVLLATASAATAAVEIEIRFSERELVCSSSVKTSDS